MNIAAIVPAHADPHVVNDTLESIRRHMTSDVVVLADGYKYHDIKDHIDCRVLSGFCQGGAQGSHANRMFGLKNLLDLYPRADWYCWIEYDAFVASDAFRQDLKTDSWVVGFSVAENTFDSPVLPGIFRWPGLKTLKYALGAVVFHKREFLEQLDRDRMFEWVVNSTANFGGQHRVDQLPGLTLANEMYDLGEHLLPTLAAKYGKGIDSLSHWRQQEWLKQTIGPNTQLYWDGNSVRYPIRWNPALRPEENILGKTSILHPLKEYDDPIRVLYRERR